MRMPERRDVDQLEHQLERTPRIDSPARPARLEGDRPIRKAERQPGVVVVAKEINSLPHPPQYVSALLEVPRCGWLMGRRQLRQPLLLLPDPRLVGVGKGRERRAHLCWVPQFAEPLRIEDSTTVNLASIETRSAHEMAWHK